MTNAEKRADWRERNLERAREIDRESARRRRAAGRIVDLTAAKRARAYRERQKTIDLNAYRAQNRERQAKWRKANPEKWRHRQTRSKWDPEYGEILLRDPCAYCGGAGGEIDHIEPVAAGGDGVWSNLTAACRACNNRKNAQPLLRYMAKEV